MFVWQLGKNRFLWGRRLAGGWLLGIAGSLLSCRYFDPEPRLPPSDALPALYQTPSAGPVAPGGWWPSFAVDELSRLIETALADNLGLAQAAARLRQMQALAVQSGANRSPQLVGEGSAASSRSRRLVGDSFERESSKSFALGLLASYEVDLWGRVRATANLAELEAMATAADRRTVSLTVAASVTSRWLAFVAIQMELAIVNRQLDTNRQQLELLQARQRRAMATALDVLQQQQIVAATEALLPPLERERQLAIHQLNLLLGRQPAGDLELRSTTLPELPPLPELGIPAELLVNRPDLEAAWQRLEAARWGVAAAQADRLPAIRLTGAASYQSGSLDQLFDGWARNLAASLAAPLLDGGRRRAEIDRTRAVQEQRLAYYRETALVAVKEVEDALVRERFHGQRLAALRRQYQHAEDTLQEADSRYRRGLNDYLPVLSAIEASQRLERTLLLAEYDLLANRVDLCRALGGQWPTPPGED